MSLPRWFRKNKTKVMAIVVVVLLIGWVGGTYLQQLGQRRSSGIGKTVAYTGKKDKITNKDLIIAREELEILNLLGADRVLTSISLPIMQTIDLRPVFLCQLLFPGKTDSAQIDRFIKQTIRTNEYPISDSQINDISNASLPPNFYWLVLTREAQQTGLNFPNEQIGDMLGRIIPQVTGSSYSDTISPIVNQRGIPEDRILDSFGKLVVVLEYAKASCSNEAITVSQLKFDTALKAQTIDANVVKFESAVFAKDFSEPTSGQITEHFEKYKSYFTDSVSEENPYGFGYKLPETAVLEYAALKLDDVEKTVEPPTAEQTEDYYQRFTDRFTTQVPSDPQDPNSPLVERTRSYAEVADLIYRQLLQNKINSKAETILQLVKSITESRLEGLEKEPQQLTPAELAENIGSFEAAAEKVSEEFDIKLYTGRTGRLSAVDMQLDEYLSTLYLTGFGYNPVRLTKAVFAIDELATSQLGPFDPPKPKMHQNIGPVKDALGRITALLRIVDARKAAEPDSIDLTFSKQSLALEKDRAEEKIYSVKEVVGEDLKKLAALPPTRQKAREFVALASKYGWKNAVETFNSRYSPQDSNTFKIRKFTNLARESTADLQKTAIRNQTNPEVQFLLSQKKKEQRLRDHLYSLVPQDANTIENLPLITESKQDMSYLCIKDIKVNRINLADYQAAKAIYSYHTESINSQAMAAVHFNPDNILKRMKFRWLVDQQPQPAAEPDSAENTEGQI